MIRRIPLIVFLHVLLAPGISHAAALIKVITQSNTDVICYKGSEEDVVEMVNAAVKLIDERGVFRAFHQIMQPHGGFIKGELYVFVLNREGTLVANGAEPRSVGSNALLARDKNGHFFVREMLQRAYASGQGWIQYQMRSPCSGQLADKQVFFKRAGEYVIGAGFYHYLGL